MHKHKMVCVCVHVCVCVCVCVSFVCVRVCTKLESYTHLAKQLRFCVHLWCKPRGVIYTDGQRK